MHSSVTFSFSILTEENQKPMKLDQVLNNDYLRKEYFDIIFLNFQSLEKLKICRDGKKKIKFVELNLELTSGIENTPNTILKNDLPGNINLYKAEEIISLDNQREKEEA